MEITWHGHACFEVRGSKSILFDPFITENPSAEVNPQDLNPDILLITHGHEDHIGDALDIARRSRPEIAVIHEIASFFQEEGVEAEGMNFYGTVELGGVKVTLVPALHSSSYSGRYMGDAGGYVVDMEGVKVYNAGDTGIFGDMDLIREIYRPEVMLVPIGDRFTMNSEIAAKAVEMVSPRIAVPMHFATFPFLTQEAGDFKKRVEERGRTSVVALSPGESYSL